LEDDEKGTRLEFGQGLWVNGRIGYVVYIDRQDGWCELEFKVNTPEEQLVYYEIFPIDYIWDIVQATRKGWIDDSDR